MLLLIEPSGADATENIYGAGLLHGALASGIGARRVAVADASAAASVLRAASEAQLLIDARLLAGLDEAAATAPGLVAMVQHASALGPRDAADPQAYAMLSCMEHVVVPGAAIAQALGARTAILPERIVVLPPGCDPAPRANGGDAGCAVLWRGPAAADATLLRDALRRLTDLDWSLTIATPEPAGEAGPASAVRHIDARDPTAMQRAWHDADLLVVASDWCASDRLAREGLRRGLPVVVCAGGDSGAILDPTCGLGVTPGDVEQLSKALRRMIFDRPLRLAMSQAAWQRGLGLPDWGTQARALLAALVA